MITQALKLYWSAEPIDLIPDPRTDPLIAPRTIAFWGRGVATTWRLTIEEPNVDVSAVSAIQVGVGYAAFLKQDGDGFFGARCDIGAYERRPIHSALTCFDTCLKLLDRGSA
jgi:hypothetical protein